MFNDMPPVKRGCSNLSLCFFMLVVCANVYVVTEKLILRRDKTGATEDEFMNCTSDLDCNGFGQQIQCIQKTHDTLDRYAVASILIETDKHVSNYVRWAIVLGYSLRKYGRLSCSIDMILLASFEINEQNKKHLELVGWTILLVSEINAPVGVTEEVKHARYAHTFTKCQIFNMTAYTAVLYMDLDTLVVGRISDVFENYIPEMIRGNTHVGWTYDIPDGDDNFNSGVLLIRPSRSILDDMVQSMNTLSYSKKTGDQGFLNAYFESRDQLVIPQTFNVVPFVLNKTYWGGVGADVKIIHFVGIKPDVIAFLFRCWWRNAIGFCNAWYDAEKRARLFLDANID